MPEQGRPFIWLDVFTDRPLVGNGLAVVLDADGLGPGTMLAFAREVGLSETTFVQSPDTARPPTGPESEEQADYRNRIWTVSSEIPFAGHPSLGTAVAVAIERGLEAASFVQQTGVGLQTVEATSDGGSWRASMLQPPAEFGPVVESERIAAGLGLAVGQLDPELSSQIASTGLPALLVPVRDLDALASCTPDFDLIREIDPRSELNAYPFFLERGSRTVRARCFGADLSGIEDPATGSAAGPLLAYLQDCLDIDSIVVEQGFEMGRPSRIEARMEAGCPRISGAVSVIVAGTVHLP
ncbi:MAG: PhzF family phenazine biosynthesis protein [Thermoleophilia bacterium]|nr:PhzF family phenazine biosynthesis protein [Thermoleophilia bacterium]